MLEFETFPKIPRYSRDCIVTEKIDGTNAQIIIDPMNGPITDYETVTGVPVCYVYQDDIQFAIFAGSRKRFVTPEADNFGFAKWVQDNAINLIGLGPGKHFGEWWGQGIQRGYGLKEKRFSLFNVIRWDEDMFETYKVGAWAQQGNPNKGPKPKFKAPPACCHVVQTIMRGEFCTTTVHQAFEALRALGSYAVPGFMQPEGIVIFHVAGSILFKKSFKGDEKGKSEE